MIGVEQAAAMAAILTLVGLAVYRRAALRARLDAVPLPVRVGVLVAAVVALLVRAFVVEPAFVHGDFQGPLIVETALAFPSTPSGATYGRSHGPGSFALLGPLSWLTGRSAEGVLLANVVVSALVTFPLAIAAARLARRPSAALWAAALWAGSPLVGRLAHSEDAHVTGLLFALIGLAAADVAAAEASRVALAAATIATLLAVWTRQTYYPFAVGVAVLLLERTYVRRLDASAPRLGRAELGVAILSLVLFTAARALRTATGSDGREILIAFELFPSHPGLLRGWAASHPLWPSTRLPVVVTLACALGLLSIARRSPVRFAVLGTFLLLLALTLPAAWPRVGVRWSFRLPLYGLALVVAGVGAASFERRLRRGAEGLSVGAAITGGALALTLGALGSAWRECRAPDPEMTEYRWLRAALADLPRPAILIGFDEGSAAWRLPTVLGTRAGIQVQRYEDLPAAPPADGPPYVLFEGLGCYTRSLPELLPLERFGLGSAPMHEVERRVWTALFDVQSGYGLDVIELPRGPRAACARLLAHTEPLGPEGPVIEVTEDPPMSVYGEVKHIRLRLRRWRP